MRMKKNRKTIHSDQLRNNLFSTRTMFKYYCMIVCGLWAMDYGLWIMGYGYIYVCYVIIIIIITILLHSIDRIRFVARISCY